MNNLTLQQTEKLGLSKWMNEKERNKAIDKDLEEQKQQILTIVGVNTVE